MVSLDAEGFVRAIVEKPRPGDVAASKRSDGRIGVSMNIFRLSADDILPYLESIPLHPERNEKELPVAVTMLASARPGSVYAIPRSERVPDLTQVADIPEVLEYLKTTSPVR